MPWWRFLFWNAAGGIAWAVVVGLAAFYGGKAAVDAVQRYGLYAVGGIAVLGVAAWLVLRRLKGRFETG